MTDDGIKSAIEYFKVKLDIIDERLHGIEQKQDEFKERFLVIDAKKTIVTYIIANWMKIAAVTIPLLFMLGEISIHIRNIF